MGVNMKFLLQASMPSDMMKACYQALPRPKWEGTLYYSVIFSMLVMFFSVTITSHFEANRLILERFNLQKFEYYFNNEYDRRNVLDFKNIRPSSGTAAKCLNRKMSADSTEQQFNHTIPPLTTLTPPPPTHSTSTMLPSSYSEQFSLSDNTSLLFCLVNRLLNRHSNSSDNRASFPQQQPSPQPQQQPPCKNKLPKNNNQDNTTTTTMNGHLPKEGAQKRIEVSNFYFIE